MSALTLRLRLGLLALGSVLVVGSLLVSRTGESGKDAGPASITRGIVVICFDTLRADGLGLPGETPCAMPRLQKFAQDATLFVDATANSSWTEPSVASLLTGLRPSNHGMLPYFKPSPLAASVETLAERLRAGGWATGAISGGGWISPDLGFGQGFDTFATNFDQIRPETAIETWDRARAKDRPFFLFLHTYAAHDPYGERGWLRGGSSRLHVSATLTPAELATGLERGGGRLPDDLLPLLGLQFLTDPQGRRLCRESLGGPRYDALLPALMPWYEGGYALADDRVALESSVRASYRSGLAGADEAIDDALTVLARRGLLEGTDVIITGDHGEAFGEHKTLWHGLHLYDEVLRVPLVVRAHARVRGAHLAHGACDLTDVAPTVLALAGLPPAPDLEGRSLLALAERPVPGRTVVAEMERSRDLKQEAGGRMRLFAARSTEWKWILRYDPADATVLGEELYDLAKDPGETHPLPAEAHLPPAVGVEFRRVVETERARVRRLAGTPAWKRATSSADAGTKERSRGVRASCRRGIDRSLEARPAPGDDGRDAPVGPLLRRSRRRPRGARPPRPRGRDRRRGTARRRPLDGGVEGHRRALSGRARGGRADLRAAPALPPAAGRAPRRPPLREGGGVRAGHDRRRGRRPREEPRGDAQRDEGEPRRPAAARGPEVPGPGRRPPRADALPGVPRGRAPVRAASRRLGPASFGRTGTARAWPTTWPTPVSRPTRAVARPSPIHVDDKRSWVVEAFARGRAPGLERLLYAEQYTVRDLHGEYSYWEELYRHLAADGPRMKRLHAGIAGLGLPGQPARARGTTAGSSTLARVPRS